MFGWLKRGPERPDTALAMIGARSSDEVLFLGAANPSLAAETGAITRLNGRTVVIGHGAGAADQTERAAERAGGILEFVDAPAAALPFDRETFHIVVAPDASAWTAGSAPILEAARVLRPGGRVILIDRRPKGGPLRLARSRPPQATAEADAVVALLTASGFIAARRLADTDGVVYYEARKSRE